MGGRTPSRRVSAGLSVLALCALNFYVFYGHWKGSTSFTFDFPMAYYAFTDYWITSLQHGEWPHWIPYQSYGYPSAMNPQLGLFYPPFWAFVISGVPYSLHAANIFQVLHVLWGSIGFLCFARRLFRPSIALAGAVGFALYGGFYSNAQHPDIVRGFAWIPWLFWALMLDPQPSRHSVLNWAFASRLTRPNVVSPLVVGCFITGVYPGVLIAGLLIALIFITTQALAFGWRSDRTVAARDWLLQLTALCAGAAISAAYLLPTMMFGEELRGARGMWLPWRLTLTDLLQIVVPSRLVDSGDYSMTSMLLPPALILFVSVARLRRTLAVPLIASSLFAAVMCLVPTAAIANWLVQHAPFLRLSRFPNGDYRTFIAFGLLTAGIAGLERVVYEPGNRLNLLLRTLAVALLVGGVAAVVFANRPLPAPGWELLRLYGLGVAVMIALVLSACLWRPSSVVPVVLVIACSVGFGVPSLILMQRFWTDPGIETYLYDRQELPLAAPDGSDRTELVFERDFDQRPARTPILPQKPGEYPLSWRGYIDGSFMPGDLGGGTPPSRRAIDRDPSLKAVMMQPGQLRAVSCTANLCDQTAISTLPSDGVSPVGRSLHFGRNEITYDVTLPERSLVVENEATARGWSGICDVHGVEVKAVIVGGALRGWVLEAGHHRLHVTYRTPRLIAGSVVSGLSLTIWLTAFLMLRRRENPSVVERFT